MSWHVFDVERVTVDHLAAAQRKDLYRGLVAVDREPDYVDVADAALLDRLPLAQAADREQPVAVPRRLFEALALRCVVHLLLELALDGARVAGEEVDHPVDDLGVGLLRDVVDAGCVTALDVVIEARDSRVPARLRTLAGPVLEDAIEDIERFAHLLRVRVRPEVGDAAAMPLAREHDPREVVADRDSDVWQRKHGENALEPPKESTTDGTESTARPSRNQTLPLPCTRGRGSG